MEQTDLEPTSDLERQRSAKSSSELPPAQPPPPNPLPAPHPPPLSFSSPIWCPAPVAMTRRSNVLYLAPALVNALFLYILFASTRSSEQCSLPPSSHSSSTGHRRPGLPKLPASNNPNQRHFFQYSPSLHSSNNHLRPLSGGLGSDSSSPERKLIGHPHYSPLPKDGSTYATALSAPYPSTQQEQLYPSSSQDIITYLASLEHEETARAEQLRHALNAINPDDEISDRGFRYLLENQAAIKRVLVCLAEGVDGPSSCGENETKIALLIQ